MNRAVTSHASLSSPTHRGLNWRLACVGYFGAAALCSGLAFVGLCRGELVCVGVAAGFGGLAVGLRVVLRRWPAPTEEGEPAEWTSDVAVDGGVGVHSSSAVEKVEALAGLLREWSELEQTRGTRRFDPWAWQSLRTEIQTLLRDDADVRRMFGPGE